MEILPLPHRSSNSAAVLSVPRDPPDPREVRGALSQRSLSLPQTQGSCAFSLFSSETAKALGAVSLSAFLSGHLALMSQGMGALTTDA